MTQTAQIRLLLFLAALTCLTALIGAWLVSAPSARNVSVEGAFGWLDEHNPDELMLHIHLVNLKNSDETVVGVDADDGRLGRMCETYKSCADKVSARLAKSAETVLSPSSGAYITLASANRPFEDGEVTLIELVLASGQRVPVDVKVRKR